MKILLLLFAFLLLSPLTHAAENFAISAKLSSSVGDATLERIQITDPKVTNFGWGTTLQKGPVWVLFDFGKPRNVGAFIARWNKAPSAYTVSVSTDGVTFKDIKTIDGGNSQLEIGQGFGFPTEHVQYLRLTITKAFPKPTDSFSLTRIEIYEF